MSAWLPVAPCTPQTCARHTSPVRAPLPAVLRLLAGCTWTLLGVACALPVRLLPEAPRARLVRRWARGVPRAFGVGVTARVHPYAQGTGGELVVANHVSWLDIPLVASVLPGRMLAKSEVGRWPLLGRLAGLGGTLFIDRDRLRALPGAVGTVAEALRSGSRVVAFPEGSTWCGRGSGGVFRPAVFQAAIDAEVSVRPVRITYRAPGAVAFWGTIRSPPPCGAWCGRRDSPPRSTSSPRSRRAITRESQRAVSPAAVHWPARREPPSPECTGRRRLLRRSSVRPRWPATGRTAPPRPSTTE